MHASFPAHGSSTVVSLPRTRPHHWTLCGLTLRSSDRQQRPYPCSRTAAPPKASSLLLVRLPSDDRPHVSLSWALPQAFASWGILLPASIRPDRLLREQPTESSLRLSRSQQPFDVAVGPSYPPGIVWECIWREGRTPPAQMSCPFWAEPVNPPELVNSNDGSTLVRLLAVAPRSMGCPGGFWGTTFPPRFRD